MKRRSLFTLAGLGLLGAGLAGCSQQSTSSPSPSGSASKLETLRVHVPTTLAFMAPMASFGTLGRLDGLVAKTDVQNWADVEIMKSLIVNGKTDLVATPSYAAANLFTKGLPIRLAAITIWGMLYVLGPQGSSAQGAEGLKGKKVAVPMPNNMPDLVFRYLMTQSGIPLTGGADGVEVVKYEQASEITQPLISGQLDYAVLPEHVATVVQGKAKEAGKTLDRAVNLQELWGKVTGRQARFPMAGVVMPAKLTDANQALVGGILNELEAAVAQVNALDQKALAAITQKTKVPEAVVRGVIPRLQLAMVPARKAKDDLVDFYTRLSTLSPDIIGGRMPAEDFYLADPR